MIEQASKYSGKFVLRLGAALHESLAKRAQSLGLSLNAACIKLLESALESEALSQGLPFGLERLLAPDSNFADEIEAILLYGSYVRGEAGSASDIDVMLVFKKQRKINRALYQLIDEIKLPDSRVSLMCCHLPASLDRPGGLWLELSQDAVLLYDGRGLTSKILADIRKRIAAGRYLRRQAHGQGYWVHAQ